MTSATQAARAAFDEGSAHLAAGRLDRAVDAYRRAVALDPGAPAAHFNLGVALRRLGELGQSAAAFRGAERLVPGNEAILSTLVATLAEWANRGGGSDFVPARAPGAEAPAISIVVCSIEEPKLAAVLANFGAALGGREHEFVVIRDARSLAEGYNRGMHRARHGIVVFSHDDVELVSPDPFGHLCEALAACDVVGLAGSRLVTGPAVGWAGHPHLHGWLSYPAHDKPGFVASAYSLETGRVDGMQALDGLFFASRRETALRIAFDEATFDGFHFYDLDFTYRAHLAGLRVAVTTDIIAVHGSEGRFEGEWGHAAERFRAKFPALSGARGRNQAYGAWVRDRGALLRFYGALREVAARDDRSSRQPQAGLAP